MSDEGEELLSEAEWLIVDAFRVTYEAAVERFVREGDTAWPAVDAALVELNDAYAWAGTLMEERRRTGERPGLALSDELEHELAEGREVG